MCKVNCRRTKAELDAELAHGEWWKECGKLLGWELMGWTYDYSALFYTNTERTLTIDIKGSQMRQIMKAVGIGAK